MLFVERVARRKRRRRKTLRESIRIPPRKQPRPCPRLRASIYRRWYPRDLLSLPFSSVFLFTKKLFSSLSASSSSFLPLPSPRRGTSLPRFSSFPTCYHLVNHRAIDARRPAFANVFPSCERVSFIHMLREKADRHTCACAGSRNRIALIANRLYCTIVTIIISSINIRLRRARLETASLELFPSLRTCRISFFFRRDNR